jgi:two-component sensor histidine kinase/Tfp pilus assembly protein PilF
VKLRYILLVFSLAFNFNCFAQTSKLDSLLNLLKKDKEDTNKVIHLYKLCYEFDAIGEYDKGLQYGKQSLLLAKKIQFAYSNMGIIFDDLGNFPEALKSYMIALKIRKEIDDKKGIAACLNNIGEICRVQGNYNEALKNYFEALKLFEEIDFKFGIASAFNNIGTIYKALKNYPQALKFYKSSYDIKLQINDKRGIVAYYGNVASLYEEGGDFNKAIKNHLLGLAIAEEIKDIGSKALSYNHLGEIYLRQLKFSEANNYLQHALKIELEIEDKKGIAITYSYLSDLNIKLNHRPEARIFVNKALTLAKELGNKNLMASCYENLSVLDSANGDFRGALQNYKMFMLYEDSLVTEDAKKISVEANMQYEFDKKEIATKVQHDKIVYQLEADNRLQKQWRLFLIVVIILACLGLFFMIRAYNNKKKLTLILSEEDKRKEVLLQEVHHRINNNLQIISSLLTLQANSTSEPKLQEYLMQSQNRIQSLSALHELLYDTNSPLEINMKEYIEKVLDFHRDVLSTRNSNMILEMDVESVKFPTKLAVPVALIINELVTNSIKYAFTGITSGLIKVTLLKKETENIWLLSVADNGIGMPQESEKRKDSLGLKLVAIMTKQIKGSLVIKNDNGAIFNIIFSLSKTT